MHKTFRKRQKPIISLIFSAFIVLTIPIAIYSLLSSQNFDMRQLASEEAPKTSSYCTIHIPYVNTKTLELGRNYQVHVYTNLQNQKVENINISEEKEGSIFSKKYNPVTNKVSETFIYTPKNLGPQDIYGEIKTDRGVLPCEMDINQELVYVIEKNHAPQFLTDPYFSAKPPSSSLTINETYEYVLEVVDKDLDQIEYHYSFTPRAHWLHKTVEEGGKDGTLKIRFSGSPDKEGSYLANVFIHDGHHKHLSAQSWVINIGKEGSDIPVREAPVLPKIDSDIENEITLPEPQIAKMLPRENAHTNNPKSVISANLIASYNAKIEEKSIVFKLNDTELTRQAEIIKISESEILLRYTPQANLQTGEHRVYVYFKDTEGKEVDKEWTFTIDMGAGEDTFLGIPTTTFIISITGILLILFALSIPWIIYIAWKKDQPEDYKETPIIKPKGESSYKESFEKES